MTARPARRSRHLVLSLRFQGPTPPCGALARQGSVGPLPVSISTRVAFKPLQRKVPIPWPDLGRRHVSNATTSTRRYYRGLPANFLSCLSLDIVVTQGKDLACRRPGLAAKEPASHDPQSGPGSPIRRESRHWPMTTFWAAGSICLSFSQTDGPLLNKADGVSTPALGFGMPKDSDASQRPGGWAGQGMRVGGTGVPPQ